MGRMFFALFLFAGRLLTMPACALDITPPVISSVVVTNISSCSAIIKWKTDEPSTSQADYLYASQIYSTPLNGSPVIEHAVEISTGPAGIQPNTTLLAQVKSADPSGNVSTGAVFSVRFLRIPELLPAEIKKVSGLYSLFASDQLPKTGSPELAKDYVAGISARFNWKTLEPSEDVYSWEKVDDAVAAAAAYNKPLIIRVTSGALSPDWLFAKIGNNYLNMYLEQYGATIQMPYPWDTVYQYHWNDFVKELGKKCGGESSIVMVQMTGGGYIGEMFLVKDYTAQWIAAGYTDQKLIDAWKSFINNYSFSFPDLPLGLNIGEPLAGYSNALQPVVDWAKSAYPEKVYFQQNGLNGYVGAGVLYGDILYNASSAATAGFQPSGSINWFPERMGNRRAMMQQGISDNAAYYEIYSADLTASFQNPDPWYGLEETTWIDADNILKTRFPPDHTAPARSNGSPSGQLAAGTVSAALSLATDENAVCKYSNNAGAAFASMPDTFSTTGGTSHSTTVSGLQNGQSYSYYARCGDTAGNTNTGDFLISFSIASPPGLDISPGHAKVRGGKNGYVNPRKGEKAEIHFRPSESGTVRVKIYTLSGQLVWETSHEAAGTADQSVIWNAVNKDGQSIASGIYVAHIKGAGINEKKKVAIVK